MNDQARMATTIINQIISMQTADDQRAILNDLFARFGWPEREEYKVLNAQEVADRYGVYVRTVHDWLISGELQGFRESRKWYTRSDWVREFENKKAKQPKIKAM